MDEKTRLEARELLLRSRIYRVIALVFAAMGLVIFTVLYLKYMQGDILSALKKPSLVLIILIPFLPAFVLSRMAFKAENKFAKLLGALEDQQEKKE